MGLQISFNATELDRSELDALSALIDVLRGEATAPKRPLSAPPPPPTEQTLKLSLDASEVAEVLEKMKADPAPRATEAPAVVGNVPPPPPPTASTTETVTPDAATPVAATPDNTTSIASAETELDPTGIPWDKRIHASTKTKNQDGTWKKLRNVNEVLYGEVYAELQEQYASAVVGNVPPPPPPIVAESAPTVATVVPPPPAPVASVGFESFPQLIEAIDTLKAPYSVLEMVVNNVTEGKATKLFQLKEYPDKWVETFEAVKASMS